MRLLLLSVVLAPVVSAQGAVPGWSERRPLEPALTGTWETVSITYPREALESGEMLGEPVWVRLEIQGSVVSMSDTLRTDDGLRARSVVDIECHVGDSVDPVGGGVETSNHVFCAPDPDQGMGHWGLGQYRLDGDTLRLGYQRSADSEWRELMALRRATTQDGPTSGAPR